MTALFLISGCDLFSSDNDDAPKMGEVLWTYDLAHPEVIDITMPLIEGDFVYVAGGREVICFELETGDVQWKIPLPQRQRSVNLLADDQHVYFVSDHSLWAVVKQSGSIGWRREVNIPLKARQPLTQTEDEVWVGGVGYLARYRKSDGAPHLQVHMTELKPDGTEQTAGGPVLETDDGFVYVPTGYFLEGREGIDGNVLAYHADDGTFDWGYAFDKRKVPIPGYPGQFWTMDVDANGVLVDRNTLIATSKTSIVALDRFTGERKWRRLIDDDGFWNPPVLGDGLFYLGSTGARVYAFDTETGETVWKSEDVGASILTQFELKDGRLYFDVGGSIFVLDAETGETIWRGSPPEDDPNAIYLSPVGAGNGYMVNVGSKRIYALADPAKSAP